MGIDIGYLKNNKLIIFEAISGSKSYGLDTPQSDTDIRGVFILPKSTFYSLSYTAQVSNASQDIVYYELRKFFELLSKNNPNVLELLNIPKDCTLYEHSLYKKLKNFPFLSKLCKGTFAGYALSQVKKARGLNKKILNPIGEKRKTVLDFCYVTHHQGSITLNKWLALKGFKQEQCGLCNLAHMKDLYALYYDADKTLAYKGIMKSEYSDDIALSSIPKGEKVLAYLHFSKESFSYYCKQYKDYHEWVAQRNEVRYENTLSHGKNYDAKNMMHTFRLLAMAEEIAQFQEIRVHRPDRDFLLKVRNGLYEYEDLLKLAEDKIQLLETLFKHAPLPDTPDQQAINQLLIETRDGFYQST